MKKIGLLLFVALTGCSPMYGDSYNVMVNEQFTAEQRSDIVTALSRWQVAAQQYNLRFTVSWGSEPDYFADHTFSIYPSTLLQLHNRWGGDIVGYTLRDDSCDCGQMYYATDIGNVTEWQVMIAHETGHSLGLVHTGPGTLMYPGFGPNNPNAITYKDLQQFAHLRGERIVLDDTPVSVTHDE